MKERRTGNSKKTSFVFCILTVDLLFFLHYTGTIDKLHNIRTTGFDPGSCFSASPINDNPYFLGPNWEGWEVPNDTKTDANFAIASRQVTAWPSCRFFLYLAIWMFEEKF